MKKTTPRKGSWRKVAPGKYVKNIGSYGDVKFGARARVSFVPFPTCIILDANDAQVAIPSPADEKKFLTAAKKAYTKDVKMEEERLRKREAARVRPNSKIPKWCPGSRMKPGQSPSTIAPTSPPPPLGNIAGSIQFLRAEIQRFTNMSEVDTQNAAEYKKRIAALRTRIRKLQE